MGRVPPAQRREPRLHLWGSGAVLLIAGVLWIGLVEPKWLGWAGVVVGLALMFAPRLVREPEVFARQLDGFIGRRAQRNGRRGEGNLFANRCHSLD